VLREFKAFLMRGNVVDLAIAVASSHAFVVLVIDQLRMMNECQRRTPGPDVHLSGLPVFRYQGERHNASLYKVGTLSWSERMLEPTYRRGLTRRFDLRGDLE